MKVLKNNFGFTLLEVIIVVGIMSGLAVAFLQMQENQMKSTKQVETNFEITYLVKEIRGVLSRQPLCSDPANFGGQIYNVDFFLTAINKVDGGAPTPIFENSTVNPNALYGNRTIKITSFEYKGTAAQVVDLTTVRVPFEIVFERQGSQFGTMEVRKSFYLIVAFDGANLIQTCNSSDEGESNIWEYSDVVVGGIHYPGGNVGIGVAEPQHKLEVAGIITFQNGLQGKGATIPDPLGANAVDLQTNRTATTQTALGVSSVISGGLENLINGGSLASTIGGGEDNSINNVIYSVIAGGQSNQIVAPVVSSSAYSGVLSGGTNSVGHTLFTAYGSVIAGGTGNQILSNAADVNYSSIVGGIGNVVRSSYGVIAGGQNNLIDLAASHGFIGGGSQNQVTGNQSSIVGGDQNILAGNNSVIIGGLDNVISNSDNTMVFGNGLNSTNAPNQTVLGSFNVNNSAASFIIGNGVDNATRSNFVELGSAYSYIGGRLAISPTANHLPGGATQADQWLLHLYQPAGTGTIRNDVLQIESEGGTQLNITGNSSDHSHSTPGIMFYHKTPNASAGSNGHLGTITATQNYGAYLGANSWATVNTTGLLFYAGGTEDPGMVLRASTNSGSLPYRTARQKVGIGIMDPGADEVLASGEIRLDVNGNIMMGRKLGLWGSMAHSWSVPNQEGCILNRNGLSAWGNCASDRNLKENIKPMDKMSEKLRAVTPVTFFWKPDQDEPQSPKSKVYGVIAQDVQKSFPQFVSRREDGYLTFSNGSLPYILWQGLNEQFDVDQVHQDEINSLKKRVHELEEQNKKQEERLQKLESLMEQINSRAVLKKE